MNSKALDVQHGAVCGCVRHHLNLCQWLRQIGARMSAQTAQMKARVSFGCPP